MNDLKSQDVTYGERIGSGGSDSILSSFFRDILLDLHIDIGKFQILLDRYIVGKGIATNTVDISTSRSALRRELMSPTMTWKVFIKGLMFLRVRTAIIEITLYREDEKTSLHEYIFDVVDKNDDEDSTEPNVLAKLFREILSDLDIDDQMFQDYQDYYVKRSKPLGTPVDHYTTKCSLRREILKDSISWKVFIKGLIFLKTHRVKLRLRLIYKVSGIITEHKKMISFSV